MTLHQEKSSASWLKVYHIHHIYICTKRDSEERITSVQRNVNSMLSKGSEWPPPPPPDPPGYGKSFSLSLSLSLSGGGKIGTTQLTTSSQSSWSLIPSSAQHLLESGKNPLLLVLVHKMKRQREREREREKSQPISAVCQARGDATQFCCDFSPVMKKLWRLVQEVQQQPAGLSFQCAYYYYYSRMNVGIYSVL